MTVRTDADGHVMTVSSIYVAGKAIMVLRDLDHESDADPLRWFRLRVSRQWLSTEEGNRHPNSNSAPDESTIDGEED